MTLVFLLGGLADAQSQSSCEDLADNTAYQEFVAEGVGFLKVSAYDDAMDRFTAAQQICPFDPGVTYYMARTKHLSGDCEMALFLYDQTLAHLRAGLVASGITAADVEKRRAEECIPTPVVVAPSVGMASIQCVDAGVTLVFANGRKETCPFSGELAPGTWDLSAQLAGREPQALSVSVVNRETTSIRVASLPELRVVLAKPVALTVPKHGDDVDESGSSTLGWVSVGVGVALVGTGVALHFVAEGTRGEVDEASAHDNQGYRVVELTQAEAEEKMASANTLDAVGWTAIGLGGAAIVTGALVLLLDEGSAESDVSAAWWGEGGAVVWTRRF